MAVQTAWKIVAADGTSRSGAYHWPLVSRAAGQQPVEVAASDPTRHDGLCPRHEGDGLCLAVTARGACSGGQSLATAVGLILQYDDTDLLASDADRLRVARCMVIDVFDPMRLIRLGLYADLWGANLRGANLWGALGYTPEVTA